MLQISEKETVSNSLLIKLLVNNFVWIEYVYQKSHYDAHSSPDWHAQLSQLLLYIISYSFSILKDDFNLGRWIIN